MIVTYKLNGMPKRATFYTNLMLNGFLGMLRKNPQVTEIQIKDGF